MTLSTDHPPRRRSGRIAHSMGLRRLAPGVLSLLMVVPGTAQETKPTPTDAPALWKSAAVGVAALGTLLLLDGPVRDLARDIRGDVGDDLASVGDDYGAWTTTAPILMGGGVLLGVTLEGGVGVRRAVAAAVGVISGSFANEAVNHLVGRRRPHEELGSWQFDPFHGHASLGSGHTAYAFAIAGAVDEVTEGWWSIPFYALAAGTGLSRIYDDRHWLSDVAVGALLGLWVGRRTTRTATRLFGVARITSSSFEKGAPGSLLDRLEPSVGGGSIGLSLKL